MTKNNDTLALKSRHARLVAMQAIFVAQRDNCHAHGSESMVLEAMKHDDPDLDLSPDSVVLKRILTNYDESTARIWEIIEGHLPKNWPLKRVDPVIKAIFAAAIAEAFSQKTPPKVILREYTTIADSFFEDKEIDFIHGVISGMLRGIGSLDEKDAQSTE